MSDEQGLSHLAVRTDVWTRGLLPLPQVPWSWIKSLIKQWGTLRLQSLRDDISPFPYWRLHGKPFCITCCLADGNPFCWPQSFQSSLCPVLPILSTSFDSDCQVGASQDRCYIYNNIQQALFLWIPFGWQRGLMRMTELSACLVTVSTGNNAEQLFICIFGFSSPQKGASSELGWGGTVSVKILPSSLLVGPRGTSI